MEKGGTKTKLEHHSNVGTASLRVNMTWESVFEPGDHHFNDRRLALSNPRPNQEACRQTV